MTNPLLDWQQHPPFVDIAAEHVRPAMEAVLSEARAAFAELEAHAEPSWSGLVEPVERIADRVARIWGVVGHLMAVRNSPELRAAHDAMQPEVVRFRTALRQSRPLYEVFRTMRDGAAWGELDEAQRRIVDSAIQEAELGGVGLEGAERERFNAVLEELAGLQTRFANNVLDASKAWSWTTERAEELAGLPESARALLANNARQAGHEHAEAEGGPWTVTLDMPSFQAVMKHAENRELRERCYRAYLGRAADEPHDNTPLIARILELRAERAEELGFASYAELSLSRKMAGSVGAVEALLEDLRAPAKPAAERDLEAARALAAERGAEEAADLRHWDLPFWLERLREERYGISEEELRPYFALPRVLDGLFALVERLFAVRLRAADGAVPVWHEDVRFVRVEDADGRPIAALYMDLYSRPQEKRGGAWMNDCVGRSRACAADGEELRLPVAYLCCNQSPPVDGKPSLMTFREVETLFHECGHALQHMLTAVDHGPASGIANIEWDAVELPSQFMENWCYHRPTLMGLARHYQSGEALPEDWYRRLVAGRQHCAGSLMLRQLNFSALDLELHHRFDLDGAEDVFAVQRRLAERFAVLPPLPEDRFLCSFQHIFAGGYAAGYYSYKWAEVLSADAFAAFEEAGLDDGEAVRELGRRFRDTVLASGGGRHPMDVFRDFRGREPRVDALLRHCGLQADGATSS